MKDPRKPGSKSKRSRAHPRSSGLSRRTLLSGLAGVSAAGWLASPSAGAQTHAGGAKEMKTKLNSGPRVVVVGAGAFGGWSALFLHRGGARVTLVDAWGPGNSRTEMVARAFTLWHEAEKRWNKRLYQRTGALWMVTDEGRFVRESMPILRESGFAYEELTKAEAAKRSR